MKSTIELLEGLPVPLDVKRKMNDFKKEVRKDAKGEKCLLCGEKVTSFCNSHSLPNFVIKSIAVEGKIRTFQSFIEFDYFDDEQGVNKSGVFHNICNKCDSSFFSGYEDPQKIRMNFTEVILAQIAVKNSLKRIFSEKEEIVRQENLIEIIYSDYESIFNETVEKNKINLRENELELVRAKNAISSKDGKFRIIYETLLDYKVCIATQTVITLVFDLEGNIINNIWDVDPNNMMRGIHVCIYPQEEFTKIILFIEKINFFKYKNFINQFNKLNDDKKLHLISNLLLLYTEEVYFTPLLSSEVLENEKIKKMVFASFEVISIYNSHEEGFKRKFYEMYSIATDFSSPNLLSRDLSIEKISAI